MLIFQNRKSITACFDGQAGSLIGKFYLNSQKKLDRFSSVGLVLITTKPIRAEAHLVR